MSFPKKIRIEDRQLLDTYHVMRCMVCSKAPPCDPSHIKTKGSGGPDTKWNVVPMCRIHHTEWGTLGYTHFTNRYPGFGFTLKCMGWAMVNGKLWHPKLAD